MKNKNPEIDTGVQHEGQESNPANHQLLSQPQSKTEILILDWGRGNSQWLAVLLCWPSDWTPISVSGFLLIVLQQTMKVSSKSQNINPV